MLFRLSSIVLGHKFKNKTLYLNICRGNITGCNHFSQLGSGPPGASFMGVPEILLAINDNCRIGKKFSRV